MVYIKRRNSDSKDGMFRKFTRMFIDENIVDEVRKKQFYKKPSLQKKDDIKERIRLRAKRRRFVSRSFTRFK